MRQRWIYKDGEAIPVDENWTPEPIADYHVMGDIQPYQSMVTGEIITSRSRHREHLKQHRMIEVGNDSSLYRKPQPIKSPPGLKETVIRAVNDFEERQRR